MVLLLPIATEASSHTLLQANPTTPPLGLGGLEDPSVCAVCGRRIAAGEVGVSHVGSEGGDLFSSHDVWDWSLARWALRLFNRDLGMYSFTEYPCAGYGYGFGCCCGAG